MSFSENTGTRPNLTVSPGRPRVLGPDCAPSTLSRGVYPGLIPPTYCYNTSHRYPPPPTLTGAAHAGTCSGHPAVPSTGHHTGVPITLRCFPFAGDRRRSDWPVPTGLPNHTGSWCRRHFQHQHFGSRRRAPRLYSNHNITTRAPRAPDYSSHGRARQPGYPGPRNPNSNRIIEHPVTSISVDMLDPGRTSLRTMLDPGRTSPRTMLDPGRTSPGTMLVDPGRTSPGTMLNDHHLRCTVPPLRGPRSQVP
ncbi:hypothetical protein TIFTF001_044115 [Ficus carica]|uniref:Uncharacterized protein n=1 Tax=Ficus carica TaxID=3494 RepID=A0AA88CS55_FICCA|nr:hypothetical protein TIFTF001_044115 [Ficus carica]